MIGCLADWLKDLTKSITMEAKLRFKPSVYLA